MAFARPKLDRKSATPLPCGTLWNNPQPRWAQNGTQNNNLRGKRIALSAVVLTRSERRLSTRFDRRHVKDFESVYGCTQKLVNVDKLS